MPAQPHGWEQRALPEVIQARQDVGCALEVSISRHLEKSAWKTIYLIQSPCKSAAAKPILQPLVPNGWRAPPSRVQQGRDVSLKMTILARGTLPATSVTYRLGNNQDLTLLLVGCLLLTVILICVSCLQIYSHPPIALYYLVCHFAHQNVHTLLNQTYLRFWRFSLFCFWFCQRDIAQYSLEI